MPYIASVEVDQRQTFIHQSDTLREMLGASWLISDSLPMADLLLQKFKGVQLFWPVSGVLQFHSDDIQILGKFLQEYCRQLERTSLATSVGVVRYDEDDFDSARVKLERKVRERKDRKSAPSVMPALPYFAPCSILPKQCANSWISNSQERRSLRSWQARAREDTQRANRNRPLFGLDIAEDLLPRLDQLSISDSDSYLGILKGDVDGLGRLLEMLKFEHLYKELGPSLQRYGLPGPVAAALEFCKSLRNCAERAVMYSFQQLKERGANSSRWPFRHLIVAGDEIGRASCRERV